MKTIVIAAQKGGAGKITLARNVAVAAAQNGLRMLVLDLNPQQTFDYGSRGTRGTRR